MADDALPPLPYLQDVTDAQRKLTAEWSRWLNLLKQRVDYVTVTGIIDARTILTGTISVSVLPALTAFSGGINYSQLPAGAGTWAADPTIAGALTVTGNVLPSVTDIYDLGSVTKMWRTGYLSQLKAVLFAKETQSLYGGWLSVTKNAGVLATDVATIDTDIDFGMAMTVNQFVLIRGTDASGALTLEYMKVGANVVGNVYTVTRNLSGAGLKAWSKGTPFAVRGVAGDGWVELNAYDTPRLSVWTQGSLYSNSSETIRLGHLTGMPNSSAGIGIYMGDATAYIRWDGTAFKLVSAGATLDANGLTLGGAGPSAFDATQALTFKRESAFGPTAADRFALWTEGSGNSYQNLTLENKTTRTSGDAKASVYVRATGWDGGGGGSATTSAEIRVRSEIGVSKVVLTATDVEASSGLYERSRTTRMGDWIAVAYAGGNFTGGGSQTWTVDSGDQSTFRYMLIGKTLFMELQVVTSSIGGTPNPALNVAIPGGFTAASGGTFPAFAIRNAAVSTVHEVILSNIAAAGASVVSFYILGTPNWPATTNNTSIYCKLFFEIQ